ncbi:MAG: universal stress protein [Rhodospirillales bacterium]|nr:MAG: universal stress protein [Rhodospirillales bacterium]
MPYKTLLVHADADDRLAARITLAASLARAQDARALFVYALQAPTVMALYGEHVPASVIEMQIESERQTAAGVHAKVEEQCRREGLRMEWRQVEGSASQVLPPAGAVADLIVMGQDPADSDGSVVAEVALTAGRPILCVPHSGTFTSVGRRVLLAWNGSRRSARAAHDAIPLMRGAERVVLFAAEEDDGVATATDAAAHLAAHGVKVELRRAHLGDLDAGTALLNAVTDDGVDLLVMGAYGHSRFREFVFGGATRTVLGSMTVPTLLSH